MQANGDDDDDDGADGHGVDGAEQLKEMMEGGVGNSQTLSPIQTNEKGGA